MRRLKSEEPEDAIFVLRWWADLQFLIVMLRRLRRSASIAAFVPPIADALAEFDRSLPGLAQMRNVGEHIDAYAMNDPKRHHQDVDSSGLQVGSWGYPVYSWLGHNLNVDEAVKAADQLFIAVKSAAIGTGKG